MKSKPIDILLIEDNPGDVRLTAEALQHGKLLHNLSVVEDGIAAMEFLRKQGEHADAPTPNLILLDLNLPGKDGRAALEEIQSDPDLKQIPVIILTTSRSDQDILQAYKHKVNFINKPVEVTELINVAKLPHEFWITIDKQPNGVRP